MTTYYRKPIPVEAIQWTGSNVDDVRSFADARADGRASTVAHYVGDPTELEIWVEKSRKWIFITAGDYVVAEPDGVGIYPCTKAIFEASHDQIAPAQA